MSTYLNKISAKARFIVPIVALIGVNAMAATQEVKLGWMDLDRCRKVEWHNNGLFGTPSPTYREGRQILTAYATVHVHDGQDVATDVKQCGLQGAAAAGMASFVTSPAAAMPAFKAAFGACMAARQADWLSLSLRTTTNCQW